MAIGLSILLIFIGAKGIQSTISMDSFIRSVIQRPVKMLDANGGVSQILSNWMVVGGFLLYVVWSMIYTTWVDPGIYSVCMVMIVGGLGIEALDDSIE